MTREEQLYNERCYRRKRSVPDRDIEYLKEISDSLAQICDILTKIVNNKEDKNA